MFGFGWALIPMYEMICDIYGINIITPKMNVSAEEARNTQIDRSRNLTIEFDANFQGPWRFKPTVSNIQVHPGEMAQVMYEVVNTMDRDVDAQAIPSYTPQQAAALFRKLECFCFTQQRFGPREARQMPVVFFIDPDLPKEITTITLAYTFFEVSSTAKN